MSPTTPSAQGTPLTPTTSSPPSSASSKTASVTEAETKSIMEKHEADRHSVEDDRDTQPTQAVDNITLSVPKPIANSNRPSTSDTDADIRTLSLPPSRNTRSPSPEPSPPTTAATAVSAASHPSFDHESQRQPDIYDRFSPSRKSTIVAIVSYAAFIGPIASSAFLPSIKVMAEEMNTTPAMINYTVAIFVVAIGVAPLVWSPLSGFYGRKPVYLMSMPIMTIASIGVAQSKTVGDIIGTRILQGIGCSAVLSVGAGTVGDIYRPTERANAMAWFYSGVLMGPALSPVLAGIFTEYTSITWRATQYFLCGASALSVALIALFLPETSHPTLPHDKAKKERNKKFVLYVFNPLVSLGLMQYANVVITTVASSCIMLQTYCVMVPLSVIFQDRYNIQNVAVAGCVYLSVGIGTLFGSRIAGPLADWTVRTYMEKRGYRRPEDRLRAALWGAGLISPASCLVYGWLLWADKGGIWPPLVILVINGLGMQLSLTPVNTYLVDSSQKRSAEAIAVNNFWRYLFSAAASAFVLPMIDAIGPGWTMTFAAAMGWLGFVCIVATLKYGEGWREATKARIARRKGSNEDLDVEDGDDVRPVAGVTDEKKAAPQRPRSPIGVGLAAPDDDVVFLDDDDEPVPIQKVSSKDKEHKRHVGFGEKLRHLTHSRRQSNASATSDHDHGEAEHGEPTHLVQISQRPRAGTRTHRGSMSRTGQRGTESLTRERSRRGSAATLPSVGEVLQRTVSLSGASVHGG